MIYVQLDIQEAYARHVNYLIILNHILVQVNISVGLVA
jgi:hypothetical protein